MRYVIYGAGAIGGTVGGKLFEHGYDVVLIARGRHFDKLQADGLLLRSPDKEEHLHLPVAATVEQAGIRVGDVVLLAMKAQDTGDALEQLALCSDPSTPVVCVQNAVENERLALRRFENVYGVFVHLPAHHLEPGVVIHHRNPLPGILDIGRYPGGTDDLAHQVAADLTAAGFSSRAVADVMRWKYNKLLSNLQNAALAACGDSATTADIVDRARTEGRACYEAAGIPYLGQAELEKRISILPEVRPVDGIARRVLSSSGQSLARRTGRIEADYLNGEVVLLGRLHGVPTPVNAALQRIANRMAAERLEPGRLTLEELEAEITARGVA